MTGTCKSGALHDAASQAFDDWHLQVIVLGMMQQAMLLMTGICKSLCLA
jgi:hypothetical protein